jgi:hypothetical protein
LAFLLVGATLIFFGGALLGQAFGGDYRLQQRRGAPPLSIGGMWLVALGCWCAALVAFSFLGIGAVVLGVLLAALLLFASFLRWQAALSPIVYGLFRCSLYLLAASVGLEGITGWSIWCGLAMGCYVAGAGYLEPATPNRKRAWAMLLLAMPVFLALLMDTGPFRESGLLLSLMVLLWVLRGLRPVLWPVEPGQSTSPRELLTGIVLVDWLAACPAISSMGELSQLPRAVSFAFIGLLLLAYLCQLLARD